jgi:transcriptional regulator with XRE-family HTH domain
MKKKEPPKVGPQTAKLAKRVKQLRVNSQLSQLEASHMLGVKIDKLIRWERGDEEPDSAELLKMSKLYGVSLDIIMDPTIKIPEPDGTAEDRVRLLLDHVNAEMREDRETFFIKFPFVIALAVIYVLVCLLGSIMHHQLWKPMMYIFTPVPVWYVFVFMQMHKLSKKKRAETQKSSDGQITTDR